MINAIFLVIWSMILGCELTERRSPFWIAIASIFIIAEFLLVTNII